MKATTARLLHWGAEQRRWHPRDTGKGARGVNRRFIAEALRAGRKFIAPILLKTEPKHYLDPPVFT